MYEDGFTASLLVLYHYFTIRSQCMVAAGYQAAAMGDRGGSNVFHSFSRARDLLGTAACSPFLFKEATFDVRGL